MNIKFVVQPAKDVKLAANVSVDATYSRKVPVVEGESDDTVEQTVRVPLDEGMRGAALLEDAASLQVRADVLAFDGSRIFRRSVKADADGGAALVFTDKELELLSDTPQALPADTTPLVSTRTVRLVPTGERKMDYKRATVMVSPVKDERALAETGIDAPLRIAGDTKRITSLDLTGQTLEPLTRIDWIPAHLAVDGTFTFSFPRQQSIGWLWWLTGEHQVVGFVPDDLSRKDDSNRNLAIALPVLSGPERVPEGGKAEGCDDCGKVVPADVTEAELANNPDIYTEDPGAFCKPFTNPERVLSEKSFSVIARVTQP